jgi:hypothetical protein
LLAHDIRTASATPVLSLVILLSLISALSGCGSGVRLDQPAGQAPLIITQPADQSIPIGLQATFSVTATGQNVKYQWSRNGTPIAGATGSTYGTASVLAADTGSTFSVALTNAFGSATSRAAALTVTARAPKAGDLRFQQVDAATTVNGYMEEVNLDPVLGFNGWETFGDATGTPLWLGNNCCAYQFNLFALPSGVTGLNIGYLHGSLEDFQSDLNGSGPATSAIGNLGAANTVITSISLSSDADLFGLSWIQTAQPGGFDLTLNTIAPSDFQAAATQEGAHSRVITAVSYNAGQITYLSYGWQADRSTVYDTQVATATLGTASTVAQGLAAQGYIITASGSTQAADGTGVLMVGTRVQGDTMPRPMMIVPLAQDSAGVTQLFQQGYAIVGVSNEFGTGPAGVIMRDWIGER